MKKGFYAAFVMVLGLMMSGCFSSDPQPHDAMRSSNAIYTKVHDKEKLKSIAKEAAKKSNWRITEFTTNSLIAEKTGDDPKLTTIKIGDGYIDFDNGDNTDESDIVDLKEYMQDLLEAEEESKH